MVCILLAVGPALPAWGDSAVIAELVGRLSAEEWETREEASGELVQMGEAAVGALTAAAEAARQVGDLEALALARSAIRRIEKESRVGPTRLTLALKDASAVQAVEEMAKQAGVEIKLWPGDLGNRLNETLSLNVERETFWMAMRRLSERTGLSPDRQGRGQIVLSRNGEGFWQKPFYEHGAFLVVADGATLVVHSDLSERGRHSRQLSLRMRMFVDPKVRVAYAPGQFRVRVAVDEFGESLEPVTGMGVMHSASQGANWIWDLNTQLMAPEGAGTRLAELRAEVKLVVLSRMDMWTVDRILSVKNAERGGPTGIHTVKELRPTGSGYDLRVMVDASQHHLLNEFSAMQRSLKLLDDQGRAYQVAGGMGGGGEGKIEYTFKFVEGDGAEALGPPARLVWGIPLELREMTVPIRFRDLRLPVP